MPSHRQSRRSMGTASPGSSRRRTRTQHTAAPLAELLSGNLPVQILPGLNEIPAGIFNGYPTDSLEGILYLLGPLSWVFGLDLVPDLGDPSVNGVTFDESFGSAVQTIYDGPSGAGSATRPRWHFPAKGRSPSGR